MILADTSVWAEHLRHGDAKLFALLDRNEILMHPFVVGELALGYLRRRETVLADLLEMPTLHVAEPEEVLFLIERQKLIATGLGYVDVHLLAAALSAPECQLWSHDKRLAAAASRMGIAADVIN
jgi:predicted nucleic acid-binding protein